MSEKIHEQTGFHMWTDDTDIDDVQGHGRKVQKEEKKRLQDKINPYYNNTDIFSILPFDSDTENYAQGIINLHCTTTKSGAIRKGNANINRIADHDKHLLSLAKFDIATRKICFSDKYIDPYEVDLRISEYLAKHYDLNVTLNKAKEIRGYIAYKQTFNSILIELNNFPIPAVNPLHDIIKYIEFGNCSQEIAFQTLDLFFKKLAIKLLSIEIKWLHYVNDVVLIFEGAQGIGKTLLCKWFGLESLGYFIDLGDTPKGDLTSKDVKMQIRGKIIAEIGELSGLRKTVTESLKAFLSQPFDEYRLPYAAEVSTIPRTVSFIGTTNESEFLSDPTGARRYFPLLIVKVRWALFQEQGLVESLYGYYLNWGREILDSKKAEVQKRLFNLNILTPELNEYLSKVRMEKRVRSRYESFLDDYIDAIRTKEYNSVYRSGEGQSWEYYNAGEAGRFIFNNEAAKIPGDFNKAFIARMREEGFVPYGKNGQKKIDGKNLKIWVPKVTG